MSNIILGPNSKLGKTEIEEMIELYENYNFKAGSIARSYGISITTMNRILLRNGKLKLKKFCVTDNYRQLAVLLYKQGFTLSAIGKLLKVSRWTVKKALHIEGCKTRVESKQIS